MNTEKMGRFIAERRKDKHMTQKDFARMLNITDKAVSKWERGISCPDISLLPSVADILGVTIHELLNGEQSNTEPEGPAAGTGECPAICGQRSRSRGRYDAQPVRRCSFLCCCWPAAPHAPLSTRWFPANSPGRLFPLSLWLSPGLCSSPS